VAVWFLHSGLITLEAYFYNGVGDHLFETPLSATRLKRIGEWHWSDSVATVPNTLQLGCGYWGWGWREVIQPEALRNQIASP